MRVRPIKPEDRPTLERWAHESGFPYIEPSEAWVVADEDDAPVMACAPQQIVELYLWVDRVQHPATRLHALRLLHDAMIPDLKARGIGEVNAFLPPQIDRKFGRRLMRTFGWVRNWASFARKL